MAVSVSYGEGGRLTLSGLSLTMLPTALRGMLWKARLWARDLM